MKKLAIILLAAFVSSFASAANWVYITDASTGKRKIYVDVDTIRVYDGYIRHSNIMENSAGFGGLSHYLSAFVKFTPLEKPKKSLTIQYVFNCKNRSLFAKSMMREFTNGKTESANATLTHSSQFEPIFPDTNQDIAAEFVCRYQ